MYIRLSSTVLLDTVVLSKFCTSMVPEPKTVVLRISVKIGVASSFGEILILTAVVEMF